MGRKRYQPEQIIDILRKTSQAHSFADMGDNASVWPDFAFDSDLGWIAKGHFDFKKDNFIPGSHFLPSRKLRNTSNDIVILGDSFSAMGKYVNFFENFVKNNCRENIKVTNLGVGGYGTTQERVMWEKYGKNYKPRLVIAQMYFWNDFGDNLNDIMYHSVMDTLRPLCF